MTYFVYVIESLIFKRRYVGLTKNVARRLVQHNLGMTQSTRGYKPWKLLFFEECESRIKAREREKFLKSGSGREHIEKLIELQKVKAIQLLSEKEIK